MYLPCLPREWVSFCVSGTAEVSVDVAWMSAKAGLGYALLSKEHATLGDGQMVTGGSGDRVELDGQGVEGERWATAHGWYHVH